MARIGGSSTEEEKKIIPTKFSSPPLCTFQVEVTSESKAEVTKGEEKAEENQNKKETQPGERACYYKDVLTSSVSRSTSDQGLANFICKGPREQLFDVL